MFSKYIQSRCTPNHSSIVSLNRLNLFCQVLTCCKIKFTSLLANIACNITWWSSKVVNNSSKSPKMYFPSPPR